MKAVCWILIVFSATLSYALIGDLFEDEDHTSKFTKLLGIPQHAKLWDDLKSKHEAETFQEMVEYDQLVDTFNKNDENKRYLPEISDKNNKIAHQLLEISEQQEEKPLSGDERSCDYKKLVKEIILHIIYSAIQPVVDISEIIANILDVAVTNRWENLEISLKACSVYDIIKPGVDQVKKCYALYKSALKGSAVLFGKLINNITTPLFPGNAEKRIAREAVLYLDKETAKDYNLNNLQMENGTNNLNIRMKHEGINNEETRRDFSLRRRKTDVVQQLKMQMKKWFHNLSH